MKIIKTAKLKITSHSKIFDKTIRLREVISGTNDTSFTCI